MHFSFQCNHHLLNSSPGLASRTFSNVPITGIANITEAREVESEAREVESEAREVESEARVLKEVPLVTKAASGSSPYPRLNDGPPESETEYSSEEITVTGRDAPRPFLHFSDFKWPQEILDVMKKNKYSNPTPIQCQAIPVALEGRDLIGIAQTGSGKTLGFILPMIVNLDTVNLGRINSPRAVVLAPTRELAQQIQSVGRQFRSLRSVCVYGGAHKSEQLNAIADQNPVLIVATPGRLNDLIDSGFLSMNDVRYLVLDEADRMLDMGFEPQIRSIIDQVRREHQTLMWSATWPEEVRELASEFLTDPIHITVGGIELHANPNIEQTVEVLTPAEKLEKLVQILESGNGRGILESGNGRGILESGNGRRVDKTLIFAQTKATVDFITKFLVRRGIHASGIHSGRTQAQRDTILSNFRRGRTEVLVATDVAARGLDVDNIEVVVNYDFPNGTEDYIHRIGRTARAGKSGKSFTFFTELDSVHAADLIKVLEEANQPVNPDLHRMVQISRMNKAVKRSFRGQAAKDAARMSNKYDAFTRSRPDFRRRTPNREDYFGWRTPKSRYSEPGRPINYDDDRISGGKHHGGRRAHRLDDDDY